MAPFNPDVKDVKPVNPIGWSKSAEVPSSFASALSEGIKGLGNLVQDTAKVGVSLIEDDAAKGAEAKFKPLVNDRIAELAGEDFKTRLGVITTPEGDAPSANASLTAGNASDLVVPGNLRQDLKALNILPDARANGKISQSDYYSRLMSAASDLRSRYPVGFRDYIDKEISKITGVDPANAYMQSLIGDINATQTNQQALRNHALTTVQSVLALDPDIAPKVWGKVSSGLMSPEQGMAYAAPFLAIKATHEANMAKITEQNATQATIKSSTLQGFSRTVGAMAYEQLNSTFKDEGVGDAQTLSTMIEDHRSGRRTLSPGDQERLLNRTMAMKQTFINSAQKALFDDPRVYGILQKEGLAAIEENSKIFDEMARNIYDKDMGMAGENKRRLTGVQDAIAYRVWTQDPKATAVLGIGKAFKDSWGDVVATQFAHKLVEADLDIVMHTYVKKMVSDIATPNVPGITKEVENGSEAIAKGVQAQKIYGKPLPGYFRQIQELVTGEKGSIVDPSTPKGPSNEIAFRLFNEKNIGALRQIQVDKRDPKTGEMMPGQEGWFKAWTSPQVVQAMHQKLTPENLQLYHDWVKQTNDELFGRAIRDLGSMNIEGAYSVSWNNSSNPPRLEVTTQRQDITQPYMGSNVRNILRANPLQDTVERVNKSIEGLYNVYRGQNLASEDVEARIFQNLHFQLDPKNRAAPKINNIPEKFVSVLRKQYDDAMAEKAAEDAKKAAQDKQYGK